ncbi:hypothetical protein A3Q56_08524 [Intoshia linei]|uniref:Uncharacterized protein n=1 Tax=Intoshia linei TaxID=1819745 RepID=A0A177APM9_9BILA|nr:hypothetical protein A3Q56_08524 [Intoshia linei]
MNFDYQHWKEGEGMLTNKGEIGSKKLGQDLRKMYIDTNFLSDKYNVKQVLFQSSYIQRNIDSAKNVYKGLYNITNYDSKQVTIRASSTDIGFVIYF